MSGDGELGEVRPPPGPRPPRLDDDPGLQPQRTALAWERTALATAATGLLAAAAWLRLGDVAVSVVAASVGVAAAGRVLRTVRLRRGHAGRAAWPALLTCAAAAVVLAVLGVGTALRGLAV